MIISVTNEIMNKIYYSISDKYGWEEVPYGYSDTAFTGNTTKIEICMWRYDIKFINALFLDNGIDYVATKNDTIFLDAKNDIYKGIL